MLRRAGSYERCLGWRELTRAFALFFPVVDYILFLTADVDVTPNLNEIRDYKYVDKAELQAMFEDPCESLYSHFAFVDAR